LAQFFRLFLKYKFFLEICKIPLSQISPPKRTFFRPICPKGVVAAPSEGVASIFSPFFPFFHHTLKDRIFFFKYVKSPYLKFHCLKGFFSSHLFGLQVQKRVAAPSLFSPNFTPWSILVFFLKHQSFAYFGQFWEFNEYKKKLDHFCSISF